MDTEPVRAGVIGLAAVPVVVALLIAPVVAVPLLTIGLAVWLARRRDRTPDGADDAPTSAGPVAPADPADLTDVDIAQLCRDWRRSHWLVRGAGDPAALERATRQREQLLDELFRRDPQGMQRWLDSGPNPSEGPDHYLSGRS